MNTKLLTLLSAAGLSLCTGQAFAQQLAGTAADTKFTPGAKSESGGGGSLYNPNPYTGICDISIPIYSYATDHGDFGVSFSYNTKGVKVDQISSDIGLNWNINAGATITRIVKDLPDEMNIEADSMATVPNPFGFPSDTRVNKYWRMKGKYAVYTESAASAADELIYRDKECDDFIISLPSGTYTFNFGKNGNFVHPAKGIKVETVFNGTVMTNINSIDATSSEGANYMNLVVTDVTGCKYYFTRSVYGPKYITDLYGYTVNLGDYYLTTEWVVERVVLLNGTEINYTYNNFSSGSVFTGYSYNCVERGTTILDPVKGPVPGEVIREKKFSSIQYPNGVKVDFIYDTNNRIDYPWGAVREVKISADGNCTRYKMDQAYFFSEPVSGSYELAYGNTTTITDKNKKARLKLKGISMLSCDGATEEPLYRFDYYSSEQLPIRGSLSQDFMGYYNGIDNNTTTSRGTGVPYHRHYAGTTRYGSNRSQVYSKMKAGILTRITNGYGGTIEFNYGAHVDMSSPLSLPADEYFFGSRVYDGFRVESIIENDPWHPENSKITEFQYINGQVFMDGGYFHYPSQRDDANPDDEQERTYIGSFVTPHQFVQGTNQGYTYVTVITRTGEGLQVSRRDMTFTNFKDATSGMQPRYFYTGGGKHFYQYPYTDKRYIKDWEMGLLVAATDYDENNRIVSDVTNTYRFTLDTTSMIGKVENIRATPTRLDIMDSDGLIELSEVTDSYRPYTGVAFLDRTVTRKYLTDTRSIADTVWYYYDGRSNLKSTVTRGSDGRKVRTATIYNYDINPPIISTLYNMTQAGLEKMVGSQRWQLGAGFSTDSLLDGFISTYTFIGGRLLPKASFNLQAGRPLSYGEYTGWTSGGALAYPDNNIQTAFTGTVPAYYRETSEILATDAKGNALESQAGGQSSYIAMLWDTLSGQKIAEAASCRQADIAHTSFENSLLGPGGALTVTHGNVFYFVNQVINSSASIKSVTGGKLYRMTPTSAQYFSSTGDLQAGREYLLTFWARGATPRVFLASDGATVLPQTVIYTASDGWKQYQVRFRPTVADRVRICGPATPVTMYFDEVRLFPVDAVMNSWTYTPLFGPSSSTDASGRITYYEYDKMGRQSVILNQERHVLSKTQYTLNGAE